MAPTQAAVFRGRSRRPAAATVFCIAIVGALVSATPGAVAEGEKAIPQQAKRVPDAEATSMEHMVEFAAVHGALAGAVSICSPPKAVILKDCTRSAVANWPVTSGMAAPRNQEAAARAADQAWTASYDKARERQSSLSPPLSCPEIIAQSTRAPVLQVCHPGPGSTPQPAAAAGGLRIQ